VPLLISLPHIRIDSFAPLPLKVSCLIKTLRNSNLPLLDTICFLRRKQVHCDFSVRRNTSPRYIEVLERNLRLDAFGARRSGVLKRPMFARTALR
jgi:hypothetical protein